MAFLIGYSGIALFLLAAAAIALVIVMLIRIERNTRQGRNARGMKNELREGSQNL
jgi:hypothetical protein